MATHPHFKGTETYSASPDLLAMVNLSIQRGRPLLVTGEAGSGKTQLAHAIAQAFSYPLESAQMHPC